MRFVFDMFAALAIVIIGSTIMSDPSSAQPTAKPVTTSSGLQIIDSKPGTGASPRAGQTAVVHYTGWL
jgi:peptidylprolyl isomerase